MNVAIYARYSSDNQSDTSIEQQYKVCYEHCKRNNYTVISEYADKAMSGRTDNRPQFQKMIADSKRNLFQGIVIYSVDRFGRSVHQSAKYANELEKNGVMLISATEHITGGPSGKFTLNLHMAFAQYYSDELGQKINRGLDYNAEHGYVTSGSVPLGYKVEAIDSTNKKSKKRYVVDESTAPIVKRIFQMYANENMTMAEICRYFNEQGIKTSKDEVFNKNSLKRLLRNKKFIGINIYKGEEYPDVVPKIIDNVLFEQVQQALDKNKKATARNKAVGDDAYLLTLKLFCGHCRELMTGWSGSGKSGKLHRYYRCNGKREKKCDKTSVRKERIEDIIVKQCREVLTDENIESIASEVVAFNEAEQRNNETLKQLKKLISDTQKAKDSLMSSLKLCEDDDARRIVLSELSIIGKQASSLEIELTREESRKITLTRNEVKFFLKDLQIGDINSIKYRRALITAFVNKIYLSDDGRLTIFFNNGDNITEVEFNQIDKIEQDVLGGGSARGYFIGTASPSRNP